MSVRRRARLIAKEATEAHMTIACSRSPIARAEETLSTRIFAMDAKSVVRTTSGGHRWTRVELQRNFALHSIRLHSYNKREQIELTFSPLINDRDCRELTFTTPPSFFNARPEQIEGILTDRTSVILIEARPTETTMIDRHVHLFAHGLFTSIIFRSKQQLSIDRSID